MAQSLRARWRLFIEAFLNTWNATEAARQAHYKHPDVQGPRLLGNVSIKAAIEQRIKEKAMDADEVLARLAEQARANIADFVDVDERPILDKNKNVVGYADTVRLKWDVIQARGHLVKSIIPTESGVRLELHDGQTALIKIGTHLQLFRDTETPGIHLHIDGLGELLHKAYGHNDQPDGPTEN